MKWGISVLTLGCLVLVSVDVRAGTFYVNANNPYPSPPYMSWATAATNIQDAVDAAGSGGGTVLVTNGVYQFGGSGGSGGPYNTSRVYVAYPGLMVQSVNGPAVTVIKGYQLPGVTNGLGAVRGVYLAVGSALSGFTVTGGATASQNYPGGGIYCQSTSSIVTNCIITGNATAAFGGGVSQGTVINCVISQNTAGYGGGTASSQANNCVIVSNSANYGGGVYSGILSNCTIVGNVAGSIGGGGAYSSSLNNCIIYYNSLVGGGSPVSTNVNISTFHNCCTAPAQWPVGSPNTTNAPNFVDLAGGNFRLQIGSPCIDAGSNLYVATTTDLAGNPRVVGAAVDIGAYENQNTNLVHYVSLSSTNPVPPFTNWLTAATNLQDAIGIAQPGEIVAANAGAYSSGGVVMFGAETNRVVVTNGVTLLGVYGASSTMIVGGTQMRCAYVGSNSLLSGFTITNGHTRYSGSPSPNVTNEESGGGIWCEPGGMVANCLVVSNVANPPGSLSGGYGGGIYGGTISNCTIVSNTAGFGGGVGGGSGVVWNCTLANNQSSGGGGASQAALYNCTLSNNSVLYNGFNGSGGGASQCVASNCLFTGNTDHNFSRGGGAFVGTNFNCTFIGNWANYGGGTYQSTNYNCVISQNFSSYNGGGAYQGTLYNCILTGNQMTNSNSFSTYGGAGAYQSTLVNCTIVSNTTTGFGGGVYGGAAYNSIIYYNTASGGGANWTNYPQFYHCCTMPASGDPGGITNEPLFVDAAGGDYQLKCGSPCIDAGFIYTVPVAVDTNDIRGMSRPLDGNGDGVAQIDMGAYEYNPATDRTPDIRALSSFATISTGYTISFVAQVDGCQDYYWWDFGDGTTATNLPNVSHAWTTPGTYSIRLSSLYSGQLFSAVTTVQVVPQLIYYVNASNSAPRAPYTNWATAAQSIQTAVNAGNTAGRLVLVTNGNYRSQGSVVNGSLLNSLVLTNAVTVQSVNGPQATIILATVSAPQRCCYVGSNAVLSGFSITSGYTLGSGSLTNDQTGAGLWCEPGGVVSNCVIRGNNAYFSGGGAYGGTFYNCIFTNNSAMYGGGVYSGRLYNCLVNGNRASSGGGAYIGTFYNCTVVSNTATLATTAGGAGVCSTLYAYNSIIYDNRDSFGSLDNWIGPSALGSNNCIYPQFMLAASGNITNDPVFVNPAVGDFHLQPDSPCINSGMNPLVYGATDLDGNPRLMGGTVDMGAYEFQAQVTGTFAAWLQQYGLPTDGSADYADSDGTGMLNWQKWIAGLNPIDPTSVLAMMPPTNTSSGVTVSWQSVNTRNYFLQRSSDLGAQPAFTTIQSNIPGQTGTTSYTDITATNGGTYFYRIGVR